MSQVTKRALVESLKRLLLKKPLNKITVTDITEDCGISRMTFYYHFKDILDLVEWTCMEDVNRLVLQGVPFREAYRRVGEQVQAGTYRPTREVHHTHEGSIGNLCNDRIRAKMERVMERFE